MDVGSIKDSKLSRRKDTPTKLKITQTENKGD